MQQKVYSYCKKLKEKTEKKLLLNFPEYSVHILYYILCSLLIKWWEERNGTLQDTFAIHLI